MPKRYAQPSRRHTTHSNTYRFFVDAGAFHGNEVRIEDGELAHQLGSVLRLAAGDQVVLLDNTGWQYTSTLKRIERTEVAATINSKEPAAGEPQAQITLYLALMRPEKLEWVLQKGTEIGVATFVPFTSEHSIVSDAREISERKTARWAKILREAAEQSRRGKIPQIMPVRSFAQACEHASNAGPGLMLWEGDGAQPLRQALSSMDKDGTSNAPFSASILSGPEGGFSEKELETARKYGIIAVTLGPRTLRAETAPLVAATAMFYELGDLD